MQPDSLSTRTGQDASFGLFSMLVTSGNARGRKVRESVIGYQLCVMPLPGLKGWSELRLLS